MEVFSPFGYHGSLWDHLLIIVELFILGYFLIWLFLKFINLSESLNKSKEAKEEAKALLEIRAERMEREKREQAEREKRERENRKNNQS